MKTAGEILKQTRKKKRISLKRAAKETKIHFQYLQALEEDNYQKLPSLTSAKGFLKNYAEFLGLSSIKIMALFRRDFAGDKAGKLLSRQKAKPLTGLKLTKPQLTTIVAILVLGALFLAYLVWQYLSLASAPYY